MMPNSQRPIAHPFPYQGSKRSICRHILPHIPASTGRLVEPFCGSAAVSLAVAAQGWAKRFWLNDANAPLMALWREILERPVQLADRYERLWREQLADRKAFFFQARRQFNQTHAPHLLLYLLARIVKGSVRYSADGQFNQSADNRRWGMRPDAMRVQLLGVSASLSDHTEISARDFRSVVAETTVDDVIYMDPPYQGTSHTRDHRYYDGLPFADFVDALRAMNAAGKSYIVSYDGQTGAKTHGQPLPLDLRLRHLQIHAGRSSQSTLLGRNCETVESLYLSPALIERQETSVGEQAMEQASSQRALSFGHLTTEELKERYGYNHPPRAAGDVREHGIPLETFRTTATDGGDIGAYRFGAAVQWVG